MPQSLSTAPRPTDSGMLPQNMLFTLPAGDQQQFNDHSGVWTSRGSGGAGQRALTLSSRSTGSCRRLVCWARLRKGGRGLQPAASSPGDIKSHAPGKHEREYTIEFGGPGDRRGGGRHFDSVGRVAEGGTGAGGKGGFVRGKLLTCAQAVATQGERMVLRVLVAVGVDLLSLCASLWNPQY